MTEKERALDAIGRLPDDATIEQAAEALRLLSFQIWKEKPQIAVPGRPDPGFTENVSNYPTEELWKHVGQHVAWSFDGRQILAADPDPRRLDEKLVAAGIDPTQVVHDFVEDPDLSHLS
jgi:hypothetical protein